MDVWDAVVLAILGYVAVVSLVRLMAGHRHKVVGRLTEQIQAEQARKQQEPQKKPGRENAA